MIPNRSAELRRHLLVRQALALSTTAKTMRDLARLERAGLDLEDPTLEDLEAILERWKLAGATPSALGHYVKATRRLLRWHGRPTWPELLTPRAKDPDVEIPPDQIVEQLLRIGEDKPDDLDLATANVAMHMIHFLPLRPPSEIVPVQLRHVDLEANVLRAWSSKTQRWRKIRLEPWLAQIFRWYIEGPRAQLDRHNAPTLLLDRNGFPWETEAFRRWITRKGKRIYSRWYPYLGLHWATTYRLRCNGYRILPVARWRAHSSTAMTERYLHVADAEVWPFVPSLDDDGSTTA